MRLSISARRMELTDALRAHVQNRLEKLRFHFDRVMDADVVLTVEKHRHIAEVTLHANGVTMFSKESSSDMYASVDAAVEKLHKQIHKFKARRGRFAPVKLAEAAVLVEEPVLAGAGSSLESEDGVAQAAPQPMVYREKVGVKPMSVEEAILQLDLLEDDFLMFTNAETQQVNVVYRKEDGAYGVIEPEN